MTLEKIKYPSLNGLRTISIVLVITHHLSLIEHIFTDLEQYWWLRALIEFMRDGHMGVNVFFVISGFLITSILLQEEKASGTISLKNFFIRRTLRIFPAYYFLLLVYFVLQLSGYILITNPSWLSAITYTKYFNWYLDWYTAHGWSLSIEEQFYIFWPLVFLCGNRFRKLFAFLLVLIVPLIRVLIEFHPVDWISEFTIFLRIDAIATGCLFALYKDQLVEIMSRRWRIWFYCALPAFFFLRYFQEYAAKVDLGFIFIPLGLTYGSLANLLIAIIMMYSVFGPQRLWFKFLNLKPVNSIGLLSYSIYLWQQLFISGKENWCMRFPQNLLFIMAAALFSYYVVERPFLRLKSRFRSTKNAEASPEIK